MWISTTAALYLVMLWNPFGFSTATDLVSAEIFYRVVASPGFESQNPSENPHKDSVLDHFSVVLLVEDDLAFFTQRWPTHYALHADVLVSLDELGAKAVVVDIALLDDRTQQDDSYEILQFMLEDMWARESETIPVFLALPREDSGRFRSPLKPFVDATQPVEERAKMKETPASCALVSVPGGRSTRKGRLYELFQREQAWQDDKVVESGQPVWSAALAAYLATRDGWDMAMGCRDWMRWPLAETLSVGARPEAPSPERMMEVVWAARDFEFVDESGTYRNNGLFDCKPALDSVAARFVRVVRDNLMGLDSHAEQTGLSSSLLQICGPFQTVDLRTLFAVAEKSAEERNEREKAVEDMLKGRVVFYGAAVTAVEDRVEPPTHAPLPAVYFHAMAAANLLAYEEDYKRPSRDWHGIPMKELLLIAVIAMGILIRSCARSTIESDWRRHRRQPGQSASLAGQDSSDELETLRLWLRSIGTVAMAMAFYVLFAGSVTFVAWSELNLAPVNFVAAFSLEVARNLLTQTVDTQVIEDKQHPGE